MIGGEVGVGAETGVDPVRRTLALVLAGGAGTRLKDLTRWHAKPALPVAGHYRNIDFPLSNCLNSGIRRIGVLTQYKAHSLIQHLGRAWSFLQPELGEFVELWPAQQRTQGDWYTGTGNAVYQNFDIIDEHDPKLVLVLAGDHVYKMDYRPMLREHLARRADVTVGCVDVPADQARHFGVVSARRPDGTIAGFVEKPVHGEAYADAAGRVLASMGIYVFSADFLRAALRADEANRDSAHDFGRDVIPAAVQQGRVQAHVLRGCDGARAYWRDVGTLDAYWQTHMELLGDAPALLLGDPSWPIRSHREPLPPARFVHCGRGAPGVAVDSLVSDGCVVRGGTVLRSVLFPGVAVESRSQLTEAVVMPGARIGSGCRITRAIVASGCVLPDHTVVGEDPVADRSRFEVSEAGVVLVTRQALENSDRGTAGANTGTLTRVA